MTRFTVTTADGDTADLDVTLPAAPTYGPVSISDVGQVGTEPTDANYVRWKYARSSNTSLQTAVAALGANDILVLPEDEQPYQLDTSKGFAWPGTDGSMCRLKRGLMGLGPGAKLALGPSAFTAPQQTTVTDRRVIETWTNRGYLANLTWTGRSLGGFLFDAYRVTGTGHVIDRVKWSGAHRGTKALPPTEHGAFTTYKDFDTRITRCEVDGRDDTGAKVGSSPLMFNLGARATVIDCYVHHCNYGSVTWWAYGDVTTLRLRSEFNSSGINHEKSTGTAVHDSPTFIIDRAHSLSPGSHMSIGGDTGSVKVKILAPTYDAGWNGEATFFVQRINNYSPQLQLAGDISIVDRAGQPVPFRYAT